MIGKAVDRYWAKVKIGKPRQCWPWTASRLLNGYGQFWLEGRHRTAHSVAWTLTHGPIPSGLLVMHSCDNRVCCNPVHLSLGTHADNSLDMKLKGRARAGGAFGQDNGRAKVTKKDVVSIRALHGTSGYTYQALASKFGISAVQVGRIIRCESWQI